jgi:F-type H+-transporting ATPase subunit b
VEWDWATFLFEIGNVLVLVWLLKRFLYRPVMTVIEDRKDAVAKTLADAHRLQSEGKTLRDQYEQRLVEWEKEKEKVRARLQEEIADERKKRLATLQAEIEQEREQASSRERHRSKEVVRQAEATAVLHGTQFAAALLSRIGGPQLEEKLVDAALDDLANLPRDQVEAVRSTLPATVQGRITTAFPLESLRRSRVMKQVEELFDRTVAWEFIEDPELMAGLRVSLGGWVLRGNLQDELKFFAESEANGC